MSSFANLQVVQALEQVSMAVSPEAAREIKSILGKRTHAARQMVRYFNVISAVKKIPQKNNNH